MKTMNRLGMCSVIFLSALVFLISCSKPEVITPKPTPSVTLSANPSTVEVGQSATISVALANATSWTASNGASGNGNSSFNTGPLNKETQFTVTATGPNGTTSSAITITVNVPAPTVTLTATSQSIGFREKATINWSSTNGTTFVASWGATIGASGTLTTGELLKDTTFSVTATGPGGSKKADITITVAAPPAIWTAMTGDWVLKEAFIKIGDSSKWDSMSWSVQPLDNCAKSDTLSLLKNGGYVHSQTNPPCRSNLPKILGTGYWDLFNNNTQVVFNKNTTTTGSVWTIVSVTANRLEVTVVRDYVDPQGVKHIRGSIGKEIYYK